MPSPIGAATVSPEFSVRRPDRPIEATAPQGQLRAQYNVSILQASIDVSINAQNEPLALLYTSAINAINDVLAPVFGDNAIQAAASPAARLDNSPEGTAGRIVTLSTGFFEAFKQQHMGEDEADVLKNFMATIRAGFEKGFQEASDILDGLGVLQGDLAGGIDKTYQLVLRGYADFEAAHGAMQSDATIKAS